MYMIGIHNPATVDDLVSSTELMNSIYIGHFKEFLQLMF